MKKNIVLLLVCIFIFSCNNNQKGNIYLGNYLIPSENIYCLLDSFVREANCDNCIYEIYVNIQFPDVHHLILYAGDKSLVEYVRNYPILNSVNMVKIDDIEFKIYSGIEKYFSTPRDTLKKSKDFSMVKIAKTWVVLDSCNNYIIYKLKNEEVIPFFPLPAFDVNIDYSYPVSGK